MSEGINIDAFSWTKNCKYCFHCMTRTFKDYKEFVDWLNAKGANPRVSWRRKFREDQSQKVNLYWCAKKPKREVKFVTTIPGPGLKRSDTCWFIDKEEEHGEEEV